MKQVFTHREPGNRRLLLIFTGWSTDERLFLNFAPKGWDVMVCSDYETLDFDLSMLEGYNTVYLFAWSLGVAAAASSLPEDKITAAVAVNGTLWPADDSLGIPEAIFEATGSNLDERNLRKFRRRMFASAQEFQNASESFPDADDIKALKRQLAAVADRPYRPLTFRRAYIGSGDAIFPPANQLKAWREAPGLPEIVELQEPHCPDLKKLILSFLPDCSQVSTSFERALPHYDRHAEAQQKIAMRLASMLPQANRSKTLEIGSGSGLFTRLYAPILQPAEAVFIDLYQMPRYGISPVETYLSTDAEEALEKDPKLRGFDFALSASTIQWFANPRAFFRNAAKALKPEGRLVCSTFLPGNLGELDSLRPAPILYPSRIELEEYLCESFGEITLEEEDIPVEFANSREAKLHLRFTGVSPRHASISVSAPQEKPFPTRLTYKVLYISASRPLSGHQDNS